MVLYFIVEKFFCIMNALALPYRCFNALIPWIKEPYTGTPNSDILKLRTLHCGRIVNKPNAPTEVEGKGLKLLCDITVQQKKQVNLSS